jgi:hypothetical protein
MDRAVPSSARAALSAPALWLTTGPLVVATLAAWYLGVSGGSGIDTAAHAYKIAVAQAGGGWLWDGFWYGGSYAAATYGYLYYLVASHTGQTILVVGAAGLLPVLFWCYLRGVWGLRGATGILPPVALTVTVVLIMPFGEYPFLVGLALAMAGAALLGARRPLWAALAALPVGAALFVNPLSVLCVAVFLCADLLARPAMRSRLAIFGAALAPFALVRLGMMIVFAQPSVEIDLLGSQAKFVAVGLGGALIVRLSGDPDRRAKSMVFVMAAVACGLAWLAPHNPVGDDMGRFYMLFAVPVLLAVKRLWAPLRAAALLAAAILVLPLSMAGAVATNPGPSFAAWQAFFAPGLRLASRYYNPNYRFEVVPLAKHWEAYFFPLAGYPLAQGWYRQSDAIHDSALRGDDVGAAQYATWLRSVGVQYVFVPHAALQPSAANESRLLAGSSQFVRVAGANRWTVYRVTDSQPIALPVASTAPRSGHSAMPRTARVATNARRRAPSPPGVDVLRYRRTELTLRVARAGNYLLKESWSPYWTLVRGAGSLTRAPGDWVALHTTRAGVYEMRFTITAGRILDQLF